MQRRLDLFSVHADHFYELNDLPLLKPGRVPRDEIHSIEPDVFMPSRNPSEAALSCITGDPIVSRNKSPRVWHEIDFAANRRAKVPASSKP
jgi:hypothetical protein